MEKKLEYGGFIEVTMEDMKEIHHAPTVDEVVEAFGCCQSKEKKCKECPLHEFGSGCLDVLIANSHCIVQIGKSEIDRKTDVIDGLCKDIERLEDKNAELQKQVDELKEKIMNLKSAMIDRVARKSYDTMLTTPDDVEEIFGDAYESEFNKFLQQAVKDTAKGILQIIKAYDEEDYLQDLENAIAKRYGVEVE